jgi:hypothetical protein
MLVILCSLPLVLLIRVGRRAPAVAVAPSPSRGTAAVADD